MTTVCRRSVEVMFDLAEGLEPDGDVEEARRHLEQCAVCQQRLADSLLVVVHLRRLADEAARAEPPSDAWERLERRIAGPRTAPAGRAHRRLGQGRTQELSGIVAAALVVALAGPLALGTLASGVAGPTNFDSVSPSAPTATAGDGRLPVSLTRNDEGDPVAPDLLSTFLPHGSVPDAIPPDANGLAATVPADGPSLAAPPATCAEAAGASQRPACAAATDPAAASSSATADTTGVETPIALSTPSGPSPTGGSAGLAGDLPDRR